MKIVCLIEPSCVQDKQLVKLLEDQLGTQIDCVHVTPEARSVKLQLTQIIEGEIIWPLILIALGTRCVDAVRASEWLDCPAVLINPQMSQCEHTPEGALLHVFVEIDRKQPVTQKLPWTMHLGIGDHAEQCLHQAVDYVASTWAKRGIPYTALT